MRDGTAVKKRSRNLVATFENGFAKGWAMAVRECFKDQLDIRYTQLVEKYKDDDGNKHKRQIHAWTQGQCYCFARDHIIYDTPKAYIGTWGECLNHINISFKIVTAIPAEIKIRLNGDELIKYVDEGMVKFEISKPNQDRTALVVVGDKTVSQFEFVHILKTGLSGG